MDRIDKHNQNGMKSAAAYGGGWVVGILLSSFIIGSISIKPVEDAAGQAARLIVGILLAFFIAGIGGGIGSFIGGYTLPMVRRERGRWGYAWRSAISLGTMFGAFMFPAGFIVAMMIFYTNGADISIFRFGMLFLLIGAIYGALAGVVLAALTVGRVGLGRVVRAAAVGFGLGGSLLGIGIRQYLFSFDAAAPGSENRLWLILGFLGFSLIGGYALGAMYSLMAHELPNKPPESRRRVWLRRGIATALILFLIFGLFRPLVAALGDMLTPQTAHLDEQLTSNTIGTHWSPVVSLADTLVPSNTEAAVSPHIANGKNGRIGLVAAGEGIIYLAGLYDEAADVTEWVDSVIISTTGTQPQITFDGRGVAHLVWIEDGAVQYTQCQDSECNDTITLTAADCAAGTPSSPTIAVNLADAVMVAWQAEDTLAFTTWNFIQTPDTVACLPNNTQGQQPRLSALPNGFALAYVGGQDVDAPIQLARFQGTWQTAETVGSGHSPSLFTDSEGQLHIAWCSAGGFVRYQTDGATGTVSNSPCLNRPEIAQDSNGRVHMLWFTEEVDNNFGVWVSTAIHVESVRDNNIWQPPTIVSYTGQANQATVSSSDNGRLNLAWADPDAGLQYASQKQYTCEDHPLDGISQRLLDVAQDEQFRPPGTIVPYCGNQYDRLLFTPNPDPAFSELEPTPNGVFDPMFSLIPEAQYEVLFSTMWYDADAEEKNDSPGSLLAAAVAELYDRVVAHPEQYPRGITVRIMLGNPPELAKEDFSNQLWNVLNDVRDAGVPEMVNSDIGWRLEVADFDGALPHSHTKTMIIDGKTAVAAGYNMSYEHFPANHPSDKGSGRNDLGIQMTGPVAQDTQRMFDDLWEGADKRHCRDFYPSYRVWQVTCWDTKATADHVPDVLKYYLPNGNPAADENTAAFSMHRTEAFAESDDQVIAALIAAEETIDVVHVNFTAQMICDLNLIYDQVCTIEQATPYLDSLLNAVEENDVHLRLLLKSNPIDGVETSVALVMMGEEIIERGLEDQVEVRFFTEPMHYKATLIDDQFLIVGSQNFHYSAFGDGGGLTEYNMGTSDPQAIDDFKQLFEYHWERSSNTEE
ncbi:MAG: hypothetical protein GY796_06075 [Chloroflexi bacterium]|nr:hypothetical protein [Chloroflexota bacterium]